MNKETLDTYNVSAPALAEYFSGIGSRVIDIERAISILNRTPLRAFEIGCGDGRDGAEIARRFQSYTGIDYSEGMVGEAKARHPHLILEVADMESFEFPKNIDVIYAFASILHIDKQGVEALFKKCFDSLTPGGVLYISTKTASKYTEDWKLDAYGKRLFYYYSPEELMMLAGADFRPVFTQSSTKGSTEWVEMAFRKRGGKLIRDAIPDIIRADGGDPEVIALDDGLYGYANDLKFIEEAIEVNMAETPEAKLEELADLDELIDARLVSLGKTREDLLKVREEKAKKRGRFVAKLFLLEKE